MRAFIYIAACCLSTGALLAQAANDTGLPAPTPEPATIAMLGIGLTGVAVAAWRRNRKR